MINIPAQHQTDTDKAPCQIKNDITLGDYIHRKQIHDAFDQVKTECCGNPLRGCMDCPPPKLTFDAWFDSSQYSEYVRPIARAAWDAAQENK